FNISRDHKGDPDESPALAVVPAAKQRESLDFVCNMVLQDSVFQFDPALLARLAPNRWDHWGSSQSSLNVPVHDWILSGQLQILSRLFSSGVLNRVHEGQLYVKPGDDLFTLDEIYTKVTCAVWSELNQDLDSVLKENKPFLSSHRRDLQRAYMQYILLDQVLNPSFALPMDARAMAWSTVNGLKAKIDSVLNKLNENPSLKMDGLSLAHLKEIQARIQKAQDSNLFMQTY
ncbi:MAG: zinc-dependent metalloprotease, partial [Candidatus Omnitrophica bacterium]|nr:zinc-dependent metalloprotease [Candidatus Omnitrophota bacterium]